MMAEELPREVDFPTQKKAAPHLPISDWLNELEAKRAKEFHRRTGLDYKTLLKQIIATADPHPGMHVLEVAAGSGMIARHLVGLLGREGKIIGVDSTKELLEQARLDAQSAKVGTRIEWRVAPLTHLPFPKGDFDLVICGFGFNQIEAKDLFSEGHRVLKEEGGLLLAAEVASATSAGLAQKMRHGYRRLLKRESEDTKSQFYSPEDLTEMLRTAGFRQVVIRGLKSDSTSTTREFSLIKAIK